MPLGDWWRLLADSGFGFPRFPTEWYGRATDTVGAAIIEAERKRVGAYRAPRGVATGIVANTLLDVGSDAQLRRHLPPIVYGRELWCQLFSEPEAGSDLASLRTTADAVPGGWRVTGQKVWTSSAHHARWGLLLARTDVVAPKHSNLSIMILDMRQEGIKVRPLRQMNGRSEFNEVFLTSAFVPDTALLGPPGGGWATAMRSLGHERHLISLDSDLGLGLMAQLDLTKPAGLYASGELDDGTVSALPLGRRARDLLLRVFRESALRQDPAIRQEVLRILTEFEVARFHRMRDAEGDADLPSNVAASIGKLQATRVMRDFANICLEMAGPTALLAGAIGPYGGLLADIVNTVPSYSIASGTDEIHRNILAERHLGLPRSPDSPTRRAGSPE